MLSLIAMVAITFGCSGGSGSDSRGDASVVYAGQIDQVLESRGIFVWGDSLNKLCQQWSLARPDQSGWFYGTDFPTSSADIFVLVAPQDPLAVIAAENFEYTAEAVLASEGDTVFFRGRNGFFGAWKIQEIAGGSGDAVLSGDWFFKAGGGGDFTSTVSNGGTSIHDRGAGVCDGY